METFPVGFTLFIIPEAVFFIRYFHGDLHSTIVMVNSVAEQSFARHDDGGHRKH